MVIFAALTLVVDVLANPTATTVAPRCSLEEREDPSAPSEEPRAGIELMPGLVTGMTKDQVREKSPLLVSGRPLGSWEVVPGAKAAVRVNFSDKIKLVRSLNFAGGQPEKFLALTIKALGPPHDDKGLDGFDYLPQDVTGGMRHTADRVVKWCLGPRTFTVRTYRGSFSGWIATTE